MMKYIVSTLFVGLSGIIGLSLKQAGLTDKPPVLLAQSLPSDSVLRSTINFDPPPPPDLGEPTGRVSGGKRQGDCKPYEAVTALVPTVNLRGQDRRWGLTASDRPTIWFHFPQGIGPQLPLKFAVQDAAGKLVYQTTFDAKKTDPGVVALTLPPTAPSLKSDRIYRWELTVYCDPHIDRPIWLQGNLQRTRVSSSLAADLAMAKTPLEQARFYAQQGIWYDALTTLGMAQQTGHHQDVAAAWQSLLQQVHLEESAGAKLLPALESE